jgi:hypothetical protein
MNIYSDRKVIDEELKKNKFPKILLLNFMLHKDLPLITNLQISNQIYIVKQYELFSGKITYCNSFKHPLTLFCAIDFKF